MEIKLSNSTNGTSAVVEIVDAPGMVTLSRRQVARVRVALGGSGEGLGLARGEAFEALPGYWMTDEDFVMVGGGEVEFYSPGRRG